MLLDTHSAVFLHAGKLELFSSRGRELLTNVSLGVCPMVALEVQYLFEFNRIRFPGSVVNNDLNRDLNVQILEDEWQAVTERALSIEWTRDPFDRLIAAHAEFHNQLLLTKDRNILNNCTLAVW